MSSSYIGRSVDAIDNISSLDVLTFNGSLQTFNLTQNSVAFVPVSADALQIQIDGVIQSGNYTVSGSTVTFDFTPSGSSVCNGIRHYGVGLLSQPSDGSVNMAQLGASGTKSSSTFLAGDNSFKTVSGTTINNNADNRVITGSGTANTLEAESNFIYNGTIVGAGANGSSADLGTGVHIKTGDSGASVGGNGDELVIEGSGASGLSILSANNDEGSIYFGDDGNSTMGAIVYAHGNNSMQFKTSDSERMRIDSYGEIFVNKTANNFNANGGMWTDGGERISLTRDGDEVAVATNFINTSGYPMAFHYSGSTVGTIRSTNNSTSYNTSSDYRLKENEVAISDGIKRLKNLKPYRFNFKNDKDKTVDGFFAHEVSSVVPEAISGTKDATETYTDDNGDEQTRIKPQSIDQSKLVPLLTSALQEAITKIETLEARVQTLENA